MTAPASAAGSAGPWRPTGPWRRGKLAAAAAGSLWRRRRVESWGRNVLRCVLVLVSSGGRGSSLVGDTCEEKKGGKVAPRPPRRVVPVHGARDTGPESRDKDGRCTRWGRCSESGGGNLVPATGVWTRGGKEEFAWTGCTARPSVGADLKANRMVLLPLGAWTRCRDGELRRGGRDVISCGWNECRVGPISVHPRGTRLILPAGGLWPAG